jgi:hypothetical protein
MGGWAGELIAPQSSMRSSNLLEHDTSRPNDAVAWAAFLAVAVASLTLAALVKGGGAVAILLLGLGLSCRAYALQKPRT